MRACGAQREENRVRRGAANEGKAETARKDMSKKYGKRGSESVLHKAGKEITEPCKTG